MKRPESITLETEVEVAVECNECGRDLDVSVTVNGTRARVIADPCRHCLADARAEGAQDALNAHECPEVQK